MLHQENKQKLPEHRVKPNAFLLLSLGLPFKEFLLAFHESDGKRK